MFLDSLEDYVENGPHHPACIFQGQDPVESIWILHEEVALALLIGGQ